MNDLGRIGLVGVQAEIRPLLYTFRERSRDRQGEANLLVGQIGQQVVILAEVLPGPVHAALGAQALIARHGAHCLISLGSAGALNPRLSLGDVVVSRQAVAHDAGVFCGRQFQHTGIMGRDEQGRVGHRRSFAADAELVALAVAAAHSVGRVAQVGTVVSGNQVVFSTARKRWLHHTFAALAVDMETAAVAHVAVAHRLPWVAVRAISDQAGDELALDYGRLLVYLDEGRPAWRYRARRWGYLLSHPAALRRLYHLRQGLTAAAGCAAQVVVAMLHAETGPAAWNRQKGGDERVTGRADPQQSPVGERG